jgi:hypothetical protein
MLSTGARASPIAVLLISVVALSIAIYSSTAAASGGHLLRVNGVLLEVRTLTVRGTPIDVAQQMLRRWRADPRVQWVHSQSLRQRILIGQRQGPVSVSASVSPARSAGYSRIVISVADARWPVRSPSLPAALRLPTGSHWVTVSESEPDSNQLGAAGAAVTTRSVEYLGLSNAPLEVSRLRWIAALQRAGFAVRQGAGNGLEAERSSESLWFAFAALGERTGIVLQRRWSSSQQP